MKLRTRSTQGGFSLIELILVIALVGILSALFMTIMNPIELLNKSRDANRKKHLSDLQKALEQYYNDSGSYPPSSLDGQIVGQNGEIAWGANGFSQYAKALPKDPVLHKQYFYFSNGQAYYLFASLDQGGKDPDACNSDGTACRSAIIVGADCGSGAPCTYGVSSSNVSPNSN